MNYEIGWIFFFQSILCVLYRQLCYSTINFIMWTWKLLNKRWNLFWSRKNLEKPSNSTLSSWLWTFSLRFVSFKRFAYIVKLGIRPKVRHFYSPTAEKSDSLIGNIKFDVQLDFFYLLSIRGRNFEIHTVQKIQFIGNSSSMFSHH